MKPIILSLAILLSGCSALEYLWLVPRARGEVSFNPNLTNTEILEIFANTASAELTSGDGTVTYRDVEAGVMEIGPYRKTNVAGYSTHAEIDREAHTLNFIVKGVGSYYVALPVEEKANAITFKLMALLKKSN